MENLQSLQLILLDEINNLNEDLLIELNNIYCTEIQNNSDAYIWVNDPENLDLLFSGHDSYYIICRAVYGDYKPMDNYFTLDGYGNLKSFNTIRPNYLCEAPYVMVNDIVENFKLFDSIFSDYANDIYSNLEL